MIAPASPSLTSLALTTPNYITSEKDLNAKDKIMTIIIDLPQHAIIIIEYAKST